MSSKVTDGLLAMFPLASWAILYEAASFPIDFGEKTLPILELSSAAVLATDCGKDAFEEDFLSESEPKSKG